MTHEPDSGQDITWRQVHQATSGTDLPAGWNPIGKRARDRRRELRRRRNALRAAATAPYSAPHRTTTAPAEITPARHAAVIATGCGIVAGLLALGWWVGGSEKDEPAPLPVSAPPETTPAPLQPPQAPAPEPDIGGGLGPVDPIPPGGVAPIVPAPRPRANPAAVHTVEPPATAPTAAELGSPESAAAAWLSRWCPFDATEPYGAAETRARAAMTELGWSAFDPAGSPRGEQSWQATVAAGESARCSAPTAQISPEAPRSENSAIVLVAADRVVTGHAGSYVEPLRETRIVQRAADGLWRVDTATQGG